MMNHQDEDEFLIPAYINDVRDFCIRLLTRGKTFSQVIETSELLPCTSSGREAYEALVVPEWKTSQARSDNGQPKASVSI